MHLSNPEDLKLYATGFANGDLWDSEKEIKNYFSRTNFDYMFPGDHNYTQKELDFFAYYVIENRLHCRITYVISDGNETIETNDFEDIFTIVDEWYEYLQEEHEDLSWSFSYKANNTDELNAGIADMENEIAEQLGKKSFHGHGNYSVNAASQMGLNLTVTANFPKK